MHVQPCSEKSISHNKRLVIRYTAKNAIIPPNLLVWKFCGKAQFPHSFGRIEKYLK